MREQSKNQLERPIASRVLAETRQARHAALDAVAPGQRMQMAFAISMDAKKIRMAGLKARGFSEAETGTIVSQELR